MSKTLITTIAIVLAFLSSTPAFAVGITTSEVFSLSVLDSPQTPFPEEFERTSILSLPQFESSLGTLNSVSIELVSSWSHRIKLVGETSAFDIDKSPYVRTQDTMALSVGISGFPTSLVNSSNLRRPECSTVEFESPRFICIDDRTEIGDFDTQLSLDDVPLDFFIGDDFFDLELLHRHLLGDCETRLARCTQRIVDADWDGTLSVTYLFDEVPVAVPEPSSLILLGSGLLGLAVFRKKPTA